MSDAIAPFGLGVLVTLIVVVVLIVAGGRTSVGARFLQQTVLDAARKVAKGATITDAYGDGEGGVIIAFRGTAGLSEMKVIRSGELTVSTAFRRGVSFPAHGSFTFGKTTASSSSDSPITAEAVERARRAITEALESKGFRLSRTVEQAMLVVQFVLADDGPVVAADLDRRHGYCTSNELNDDVASAIPVTHAYRRGSLVVDVSRADSDVLLWRCAALADVSPSDSEERKRARLRAAAEAMFSEFPPVEEETPNRDATA